MTTVPYLSVVATARNDNHGGNLLRRLQTFVNALAAQTSKYRLPAELVLVEWNPPADKPSLAQALRWPATLPPLEVRIVTVPPSLHRRYRFAEDLPLYQMIGKNVGIRRARGEFVLATNIDILFSDELMEFLAGANLERGRMYRIDRHDVAADVPIDAPIAEQLAWCRSHRIRLNAIEGTFPLTPEGLRQPAPVDVAPQGSGIFFGAGWYPPEQAFGQLFRWATEDCIIEVVSMETPRALSIEIESGPGTGFAPFRLELLGPGGSLIADSPVERRSLVHVTVRPRERSLHLHVKGEGGRASDGRPLNFRALRCEWIPTGSVESVLSVSPAPDRAGAKAWQTITRGARFVASLQRGNAPGRIGLPLSAAFLERLQLRSESYGISLALGGRPVAGGPAKAPPALLHTNACGDFTLAHRDHWHELRAYPEFDLYSMNIDSLFCFMAHYGGAPERVLAEPMRIYHIEHGAGSGWTPEGSKLLFERLAAKQIPWLEYDQVLQWATQMERLHTPFVFNRDDWGLGGFDLPDANMLVAL